MRVHVREIRIPAKSKKRHSQFRAEMGWTSSALIGYPFDTVV